MSNRTNAAASEYAANRPCLQGQDGRSRCRAQSHMAGQQHVWTIADKLAEALRNRSRCDRCQGTGAARALGTYAGRCPECDGTGLGERALNALAAYDRGRGA